MKTYSITVKFKTDAPKSIVSGIATHVCFRLCDLTDDYGFKYRDTSFSVKSRKKKKKR